MRGFRGFGAGNDFAQMRQRVQNALANILTPEQMQKFQALGASNAPRAGTVWVLDARGEPQQKAIRIGLNSDSFTEVVDGLAEGDKVIVRARSVAKPG
jgi:phage gp45-like